MISKAALRLCGFRAALFERTRTARQKRFGHHVRHPDTLCAKSEGKSRYHARNSEFSGINPFGVENPEMVTTTGIKNSRNSRELPSQR